MANSSIFILFFFCRICVSREERVVNSSLCYIFSYFSSPCKNGSSLCCQAESERREKKYISSYGVGIYRLIWIGNCQTDTSLMDWKWCESIFSQQETKPFGTGTTSKFPARSTDTQSHRAVAQPCKVTSL